MELTFNLNEHKNFSSLEESVSVLSGKFMQIFNVAVFIRQIQSYYKAKKHQIKHAINLERVKIIIIYVR